MSDVDEKWEQYPNTVLEFCDAAGTRIDLRRPVGAEEHGALARLALFWFDGASFWLLPAQGDQEPRRLP
ncbi:MAG: hypothetical protein ACJ8AO_18850 [Gemmatimonadaceae bacterium]